MNSSILLPLPGVIILPQRVLALRYHLLHQHYPITTPYQTQVFIHPLVLPLRRSKYSWWPFRFQLWNSV